MPFALPENRARWETIALSGLVLATLLACFVPFGFWLGLLLFNGVGMVFHALLQLVSIPRKGRPAKVGAVDALPFISIHLPICDEPPLLVISTLQSILKLDYQNFEVIILDNNSKDEANWLPVKEFCADCESLRFYHYKKVAGFKAGAMNLCHQLADPKAKYYMVLDADYHLHPKSISRALPYLKNGDLALLQFPQDYFNHGEINAGMQLEYGQYFDHTLAGANQGGGVLSTGTLSFIRKSSLKAVGLWKHSSLTEDAEIGIHFHRHGFQTLFVNEKIGKGLMPLDFRSYSKQRFRWIYGNMQTLMNALARPFAASFCQRWAFLKQLTAWFNHLLIPFVALLVAPFLSEEIRHSVWTVALGFIGFHSMFQFIRFLEMARRAGRPLSHGARAFAVHLSLTFDGATAWVQALLGIPKKFFKTPKQLFKTSLSGVFKMLVFPTILLLTAISSWILDFRWISTGAGALCLVFILGFRCLVELQNTRAITRQIPFAL